MCGKISIFVTISSWLSSEKKFVECRAFSWFGISNVYLPEELHHPLSHGLRLLYTRQMPGLIDEGKTGAWDRPGKLPAEIRRRRNILIATQDQRRFINFWCRLRQIRIP